MKPTNRLDEDGVEHSIHGGGHVYGEWGWERFDPQADQSIEETFTFGTSPRGETLTPWPGDYNIGEAVGGVSRDRMVLRMTDNPFSGSKPYYLAVYDFNSRTARLASTPTTHAINAFMISGDWVVYSETEDLNQSPWAMRRIWAWNLATESRASSTIPTSWTA